ncbi:family 1 glycosyltransferase [Melampsora americana]|nr:family 1 glycosyltransferase [Melampsora americana]
MANMRAPINIFRFVLLSTYLIFTPSLFILLGLIPSTRCLPLIPEVAKPFIGVQDSINAVKATRLASPGPLKITCLTIGSRGDVEPYIALCRGLMKEGHLCTIGTHPEFEGMIKSHGIEYKSIGGNPSALMKHVVEHGIFSPSFWTKGYTQFSGWLKELLHNSGEAARGSDLLIESPNTMVGAHIAESMQIPYYRAFTMPWTSTSEYPHAFAVPSQARGALYNRMSYQLFDRLVWAGTSRFINKWRKKDLGLGPISYNALKARAHPFLYNFSEKVVAKPNDWKEWVHLTGYWVLNDSPKDAENIPIEAQLPHGLDDFIKTSRANKKKVVYIGFGSVIVPDPEEMTRVIAEAVKDANVHAVVSGGWTAKDSKVGSVGMKEQLKEFADRIFYVDSVPHRWLFNQIDAAVHHGGAGSTGASLRAGIPTIIRPFFGDQKFYLTKF